MKNLELNIKQIFQRNLKKKIDIKKIKYGDYNWDSLIHMKIVSDIEKKLKISIDIDDVIDMSNFSKVIKILQKYI